MRPRTKETAILMLVDAIEAASRTIDPPEREKFEEMVKRIIFVKLQARGSSTSRASRSRTCA